jgi:hypothetical protein
MLLDNSTRPSVRVARAGRRAPRTGRSFRPRSDAFISLKTNRFFGAKTIRLVVAAMVLTMLLAVPCLTPGVVMAREQTRRDLELKLDFLKHEFEGELEGVDDQKQISALALRASGRAFLASATLADEGNERFDAEEILRRFDQDWNKRDASWAAREGLALRLYFEAAARLAARLALRSLDMKAADDLREFFNQAKTRQKEEGHLTATAIEAEEKVLWSNRLCTLTTILGGMVLSAPRKDELDNIVEDLLNRAEVVAARTDIHYQAKMELLYLNDAQGLTSILFLLAGAAGSPVAREAAQLEELWRGHVSQPGTQVSDMLSLTWVANTQIALPLAWWLAADPGAVPGGRAGASGQAGPPPRKK